jgi:hypothetical protein
MFPFSRTALAVLAIAYTHPGSAAVVSIDASVDGKTIFSTNARVLCHARPMVIRRRSITLRPAT